MAKIKPGVLVEIIGSFETFPSPILSCLCWNETKQKVEILHDGTAGMYLGPDKRANEALQRLPGSKILIGETIYVVNAGDFKILKHVKQK